MKNCDLGLENAALGLRPRAAFSRPRSQFFTIRTSQPANNIYSFDNRAGGRRILHRPDAVRSLRTTEVKIFPFLAEMTFFRQCIIDNKGWVKKRRDIQNFNTYFSYRTISGSQTFFGATLIVVNPPYSLLFHANSGLVQI